jgi:hypothetical protein
MFNQFKYPCYTVELKTLCIETQNNNSDVVPFENNTLHIDAGSVGDSYL